MPEIQFLDVPPVDQDGAAFRGGVADRTANVRANGPRQAEPASLQFVAETEPFLPSRAQSSAEVEPEGIQFIDVPLSVAGGAVRGTGSAIRGAGKVAQAIGEVGATAVNQAFDAGVAMPGNLLDPAADTVQEWGAGLLESRSSAAKRAAETSKPDGSLADPSSWTFGSDPSTAGLALQAAEALGSMGPVLLSRIAAGPLGLAGQIGASAAAGSAQSGGSAIEQAREIIGGMDDAELERESKPFREALRDGMSPSQARAKVLRQAEDLASAAGLAIGAVTGGATGVILSPAGRVLGNRGVISQAAGRAALSGAEEGAQEVAEGVSTRAAVNSAGGMDMDVLEGSFGNAVMGAMAGTGPGVAHGAIDGARVRSIPVAGRVADTDVTFRNGKPFATVEGARRAAEGLGDGAQVMRAGNGFIVRPAPESVMPPEIADAAAARADEAAESETAEASEPSPSPDLGFARGQQVFWHGQPAEFIGYESGGAWENGRRARVRVNGQSRFVDLNDLREQPLGEEQTLALPAPERLEALEGPRERAALPAPENVRAGGDGFVMRQGSGMPRNAPRGIRNNNPGNIEKGIGFQGEVDGADGRFAIFSSPEAGIRALARNLLTYQDKHGLDTVTAILNRWAPSSENDTASYARAVAGEMGVSATAQLNLRDPDTLQRLTAAIIRHENGMQPYGAEALTEGVNGALEGRSARPALPAPTVTVDAQGTAQTADQRFASAEAERTQASERESLGLTDDVMRAGFAHPAASLDAAAHESAESDSNDLAPPSEAQKEAGNYRKGHIKVAGLDITVENPEGSERRGRSPDGQEWSNRMAGHYGYIRGTTGNDGDHVDAYVRPGTASDYAGPVFVIDQVDPTSGAFDEHKVMMGYANEEAAREAYQSSYSNDWKGLGAMTEMSMAQFKDWTKTGDFTAPAARVDRTSVDPDPGLGTLQVEKPASDILAKGGKPFLTRSAATRAAAAHGDADVIQQGGGFVARPRTMPARGSAAAETSVDFGQTARKSFVRLLKQSGGISPKLAADIYGDRAHLANRRAPGLFKRNGMQEDALVAAMQEAGYLPMDADSVDLGQTALDRVRDALEGEPVYTLAQMDEAAQRAYAEREAEDAARGDTAFAADLADAVFDALAAQGAGASLEKVGQRFDAARYLVEKGITDETGIEAILERAAIRAGDDGDFEAAVKREAARYGLGHDGVRPGIQGGAGQDAEGKNLDVEQPRDQYTADMFGADPDRRGSSQQQAVPAARGSSGTQRPGGDARRSRDVPNLPAIGSPARAVYHEEVEHGRFAAYVEARETGHLTAANGRISSAEDAAHALAQIRKSPQEQMVALVTDADGRPMSVIRFSIGDRSSATAPIGLIAGHVSRIKNASNVWLAHNHPSGNASFSRADREVTKAYADLTRGSHVKLRGMLAIGNPTFSFYDPATQTEKANHVIPARSRVTRIPVSQRVFKRSGKMGEPVNSPERAKVAVRELSNGEEGLLFVNADLRPSAFVPLSLEKMASLRTSGGLDTVLGGLEKSNAVGAFISVRDTSPASIDAAANVARALKAADVSPTDAITRDGKSLGETGEFRTHGTSFESRAHDQASRVSVDTARATARKFMSQLPGASRLKVSVVKTVGEIGEAARPSPLAEGVYYPRTEGGAIYLVADNLSSEARLQQVLAHEVIGHFGVEAFLGEQFPAILADVRRLARAPEGAKIPRDVKPGHPLYATMEAVFLAYPDYTPANRAREVLARMAETGQRPHFLVRVYAKLRAALRAMGFDLKLTNADLQQMVVDAGRFLRRAGADRAQAGMLEAAASLTASSRKTALAADSRRGPEPVDLPPTVIGRNLGSAGKHPTHAAAKAGDAAAAAELVSSLMTEDVIEKVRSAVGNERPTIVPVLAEEATGFNTIPLASALQLGDSLGLPVARAIYQSVRAKRTALGGLDRIFQQPEFDGEVRRGETYFLVDDTLTQGGTLASLASHITQNGGRVIGSFALTGKQYSATLRLSPETLKALRERYGNVESDFRAASGRGFDALTESEGRYLVKHDSPDAVRSRIAALAHAGGGASDPKPTPRATSEVSNSNRPGNDKAPPNAGLFDSGGPMESRAAATTLSGQQLHAAGQAVRDSALKKIGAFADREPIRDRLKKHTQNWQTKLVQGVFDQFAPIKGLSEQAYMQARLSKGTDGAAEFLVRSGKVKLTDGALDGVDGSKGLADVLADLKGEHDHFMAWIAGNRAEKLAGEGRENLFSSAEIASLKQLASGKMPDGRNRADVYRTALREFNDLQTSVMDVAEQAGLIDGATRHLWESEFYVPFYRVMEEDQTGTMGPGQIGGLVGQRAFRKLKGGSEKLGDLTANTVANWSHLLSGSMKNLAAQEALQAASTMGVADRLAGAEKGSVRVMVKGQERHYLVHDPLVLDALTSLHYVGSNDPIMKGMRKFKHALTVGVTISPTFRLRNLMRDSISAVAINTDISANPLRNMADGWKSTGKDSDTFRRLLAGGGAVRFGSFQDGQARNVKRLVEDLGVERGQVIGSPAALGRHLRKAFDWYQEVGDRAETVNRAAIYNQARKSGKTHLEASYLARDLMDFTAGGKFAAVRLLSQVVPFMNARLQGMYKLGRGAKENPARFVAVTGAVAMASALLYLGMKDDDEYKKLPDWVRNTYWVTRIGDKFVYVPKPFEVGALGTIVERGTELAFAGDDYRLKDFGKTVASVLGDQLQMSPMPQMLKPYLEASFNYDSFRDRNIDTPSQERLPEGDRYTSRTSAGAVALGKALGYSPQRIEHLVRGYFGWLGTQALSAADWAARPALDMPANPSRDMAKIENWFVVGDFLKGADTTSSKYTQRFYDQQREIDQVYAAFTQARKEGDIERARELAGDDKLKLRGLYQSANKRMQEIGQQIKRIETSATMPADEKRLRLDTLVQARNQLAMSVDERMRRAQ